MNKYQIALNNLIKNSCPKKTYCKECNFEKTCNCNAKQNIEMLQKLIDNQPLNTMQFKHFKLHSYSTLKTLTKEDLISYINMLYHNWGATDKSLCNVMEHAETLNKALDKACEQLEKESMHGYV